MLQDGCVVAILVQILVVVLSVISLLLYWYRHWCCCSAEGGCVVAILVQILVVVLSVISLLLYWYRHWCCCSAEGECDGRGAAGRAPSPGDEEETAQLQEGLHQQEGGEGHGAAAGGQRRLHV